ncbi:MAG: DEAD/DEAH box helicase [Planctomycetota bacterium]
MSAVPTADFSSLGLSQPTLRALNECGYTTPTPIQAQAIPYLVDGRDLLGIAQTGTGKTAAFALPTIDFLAHDRAPLSPKEVRCLVLVPTRELAAQVHEAFATYGKHHDLRFAVAFGGVGIVPQQRTLARGVDVLVATPGRLLDLLSQRSVNLRELEVFVLDEADRMLDMGFINDVRKILALLPKDRQSLLFSATMPPDVVTLTRTILNDPMRVEVTPPAKTADRVEQGVYFVDKSLKRDLLAHLLTETSMFRTLVFTRTKHGADRVVRNLKSADIHAVAIHGNKAQGARERALAGFRDGKIPVLVATDIAARGIDVDDVSHVINFDVPNVPETYVHRIGRTGRAGREGIAISFCDREEQAFLRDIEKLTGRRVPVLEMPAGIKGLPIPAMSPEPTAKTAGSGKSNRGKSNAARKDSGTHGAASRGPRIGRRRGKPRRAGEVRERDMQR